jgi:hypothetical protein
MSGRIIFFLILVVVFFSACEDPNTLAVGRTFSGNNLQSVYVDTFSVVTSTVQLDSVLTNGTNTVLLGSYRDGRLGSISASSYFQVGWTAPFSPGQHDIFDSIALVLPYNHYVAGDTTKSMNLNVYELTEIVPSRTYQRTVDILFSAYNSSGGFFNTSTIKHKPTPIVSANVKFSPHRDSIKVRLPDALGANWMRLAQNTIQGYADSLNIFSDGSVLPNNTLGTNKFQNYFRGLHLNVDPVDGCVAGFKTSGLKIRLYYRTYYGDVLKGTHADFTLSQKDAFFQFNNIQWDRSGTSLDHQPLYKSYPPDTSHISFIQSGTGLVTRLDFPSLKNFFYVNINAGLTLNAAYLEVYPVQGSYPKNLLPLSTLQLFPTDNSNLPSSSGISGGSAGIQYDYEFGLNTVYRYNLFSYIFTQVKANTSTIMPLILGPPNSPAGNQGSSVSRVYVGDRFHPNTKIKLKIFYTYVPN